MRGKGRGYDKKMLDSLIAFAFYFLLSLLGYGVGIRQEPPIYEQVLAATESATFVRVVDGDTIKVLRAGKEESVRIIGINTPETVDPRKEVECYGEEASQFAREFFATPGAQLTLYKDTSQGEVDTYNRLLRYVFVESKDYGKTAIEQGFGYEYTYDEPYLYQKE